MKFNLVYIVLLSLTFSTQILYGSSDNSFRDDSKDTSCLQINSSIKEVKKSAEILLYSHDYDSCIAVCKFVLTEYPGCKPFIDVLINAASWSLNNSLCLDYSNYGLQYFPNDQEYLLAKIKSLYFLGRYSESGEWLSILLKTGYYHLDFEWLVPEIRKLNNQSIQINSSVYFFKHSHGKWNYNSLGYGFRVGKLYLIPRFDIAQMIDDTYNFGDKFIYQYEIQLFPKLKYGIYPFIDYAYSASDLQPQHKVIAEIYKSLKKSKSVSAGFYYFKFHDDKELYTFSLSAGKYFSKFEVVFKPYYTFNQGVFNQSYSLITKKVLNKYDNYFSLTWRIGKTPFNPYFLIENTDQFISTKDYRIYGEFQHTISSIFLLKAALGINKDVYSKEYIQSYIESNVSLIIYI